MTKAFLVTGHATFDAVWPVVLHVPKSQFEWVYEVLYGMLVNGADQKAWVTGGETTPEEAAAIFEAIVEGITVLDIIGTIVPHVLNTIPPYALPCDNATYLRVDWPELYAVLPPALIVDADHFKTPELINGRFPRGGTLFSGYGTKGGANSVVLTTANMPAHSHTEITATPTLLAIGTGVPAPSAVPGVGATGSAGAGTAVTTIPSYSQVGYMIIGKNP